MATSNSVEIVAERSMYWDKRIASDVPHMLEGTSATGVLTTGSLWTVPEFNLGRVKASDDFDEQEWQGRPAYTYKRYAVTESGVSPRLRPGFRGQQVHMLGAEHDEDGFWARRRRP